MKSCLFLLLALSAAAVVSGRVMQDDVSGRSLLQSASQLCPDGCNRAAGGCIQDNTAAGLRCQLCLNNLLVNKVNGKCGCPAGKYAQVAADGTPSCVDCPKGSFCQGGDFNATASPVTPVAEVCPTSMTTLGRRSTSNRACVQEAGFFYTIDASNVIGATICPVDSYSPGLKKQRACVPCPTGFTTNGTTGNKKPADCLVPAGYYLKAPGQVAPCPKGEYKELLGPAANCSKCAFGVTTVSEGSPTRYNCTILVPGYYALEMNSDIVTKTVICPQGYYCPGGRPPSATPFTPPVGRHLLQATNFSGATVYKCDGDTLTVDIGSYAKEQCLVPPGYYYNGTVMLKCAPGSYRADWKPKEEATACISCGDGVKAATTDQIKRWNTSDEYISWMEPVTSSSDDCYIQAGQGLYYTSTTATWRARNCDSNTYGVPNVTFGLTPQPCKDCPSNMVAVSNATTYPTSAQYFTTNADGTRGFISALACVTQDGYGYNGRVAQKCAQGKYNNKDNYLDCKDCPYGMTTQDVGAGYTQADCGVAAGFGWVNGKVDLCPIGTYNNDTWDSGAFAGKENANCTVCPDGTTTAQSGSNSDLQCSYCQLGRGGVGCNITCGGDTDKAWAGCYGPAGRSTTTDPECLACTTQTTGYSFSWQFQNDVINVSSISPVGANASTDCLAKYSQTFDGAWYLPVNESSNATLTYTGINNFSACVAKCDALSTNAQPCQFLTYDYIAQKCYIRRANTQVIVGAPVIGYKAVPSGDVGTNAWNTKKKAPKTDEAASKALASGRYSFYQDPLALEVGTGNYPAGQVGQKQPDNRLSYTKWQDCLNACDDDYACTAFIIQITVNEAARPGTCRLIYGIYDVAEFKRSFVRADISRLYDITGLLK